MKIKAGREGEYRNFKLVNRKGCELVEAWTTEMESKMAQGATIAECACGALVASTDLSILDGMAENRLFLSGCAATVARFWEHGEEFEMWVNESKLFRSYD
jgi:hypothetical protein